MQHLLINKFINLLMKDGKKAKATKIVLKSFEQLNNNTTFLQALENVAPSVEIRKVRKAGTTFLVPAAMTPQRGIFKAMGWIIDAANASTKTKNRPMFASLAEELFLASQKQGKAREKRNELHKIALDNRAYTRYRWW